MKMMKLLGAASTAALIAGAAHAQLDLVQVASGGHDIAAPIEVAEEIDFAALSDATTGDSAIFGLEVLTQGQVPPGQNILLSVSVANGAFSEDLVDGTTYVVNGATGAVVQSGGAAGSSSVQFLITSDTTDSSITGGGVDGVALELPVFMSSCDDLTFSVTEFETEVGGNAIEGGAADLSDGAGEDQSAVTCVDAFTASVAPDADNTTISFAGGFTTFVSANSDTSSSAELGEFEFAVDTTVFVDLGTTLAAPGMADGFNASVDFADTSGLATGNAVAGTGPLFATAATAPAANSIGLAGTTAATTSSETGQFFVQTDGDPIMAQVVTVSGAELTLDDTYLQATDPFLSADVEDLVFNGSTFGPFDWVADTTGRVNSIFRITGLDMQTDDISSLMIVDNSRNGTDGVYPFTLLASDIEGSEVRMVSSTLEGIAGSFGTADITFIFGDTLDLDVDRLLSGPSTATVVPFGDGANQDGVDADSLVQSATQDDDGNY